MGQVLRFPGMSISVWKEHGEIFEAMVQGNKETAAALMRSHLLDAFERVKHEGSPEFLSPNPNEVGGTEREYDRRELSIENSELK
jgi:calcineurin-like phosphoesterase family protein